MGDCEFFSFLRFGVREEGMGANTDVIGSWLPRRCWGRRLWRGVDRRGRRQGIREGKEKGGILHT